MKYLFTALVSGLIIVAVLLPGPNLPDVGIGGVDKIIHIGMFGVWALAVRYDFRANFKFIVAFATGFFFSLSTEVAQVFVEGRTFDWYDVMADAAGLLIGLMLAKVLLNLLSKLVGRKTM